jgi:hypothetical protein
MTFKIAQTKTTPFAEFRKGYILLKGKSVPLDRPEIFDTFSDRLEIYFQTPKKHTCIDFNFTFLNATSKRYMIHTFNHLEKIIEKGSELEINWYYLNDNEDIKEFGEICKSLFKMNIQLMKTL